MFERVGVSSHCCLRSGDPDTWARSLSYGRVLLSYEKGNGPATKCLELVIRLPRERMQLVQVSY